MPIHPGPSSASAPVAPSVVSWYGLLPLAAALLGAWLCLGCSTATAIPSADELAAGLTWEGRESNLAEVELANLRVVRDLDESQKQTVRVRFVGLVDPDHKADVDAALAATSGRLQEALRTLIVSAEPTDLEDPELTELKLAAASTVRVTLRTPYVRRVIVGDWSTHRGIVEAIDWPRTKPAGK